MELKTKSSIENLIAQRRKQTNPISYQAAKKSRLEAETLQATSSDNSKKIKRDIEDVLEVSRCTKAADQRIDFKKVCNIYTFYIILLKP